MWVKPSVLTLGPNAINVKSPWPYAARIPPEKISPFILVSLTGVESAEPASGATYVSEVNVCVAESVATPAPRTATEVRDTRMKGPAWERHSS